MAGYAYIENGQIAEIHYFLPNSWRNISNLNAMSDSDLESVGWLPIIDDYQDYDPTQFEVTGTDIIYQNGVVNRIYILTPITQTPDESEDVSDSDDSDPSANTDTTVTQ